MSLMPYEGLFNSTDYPSFLVSGKTFALLDPLLDKQKVRGIFEYTGFYRKGEQVFVDFDVNFTENKIVGQFVNEPQQVALTITTLGEGLVYYGTYYSQMPSDKGTFVLRPARGSSTSHSCSIL